MFVKIFQVSADKEKGKQSKLVQFSPQNLFQIHACVISARKAKHLDITTVFAESHLKAVLGPIQSARNYLSYRYFINC